MAYNSSDIVGLSLTEKDVGMILESVCNTSCLPSIWTVEYWPKCFSMCNPHIIIAFNMSAMAVIFLSISVVISVVQDLAEANDGSFDSTAASDMCCCLLSHLLLDLWKRAGPETSFTLALVLLQRQVYATTLSASAYLSVPRAASSLDIRNVFLNMIQLFLIVTCTCRMLSAGEREAQLRAFDLLYNMSLHCEAFLSSSDNTSSPEQVCIHQSVN